MSLNKGVHFGCMCVWAAVMCENVFLPFKIMLYGWQILLFS